MISSPGTQADWVLDNAVDASGNIYAVGYTTGALQGSQRGDGDAYIVRFDRNLANPVFRQVGTAQSDQFRRMRIAPDGAIFAVGYSYGGFNGFNADRANRTGDVILQRFDASLAPTASLQFGSPNEDRGYLDLRTGVIFVGGMTEGAIATANQGAFDGFVVEVDAQTMQLR